MGLERQNPAFSGFGVFVPNYKDSGKLGTKKS